MSITSSVVLTAKLACNRLTQKSVIESIKAEANATFRAVMVDRLLVLIQQAGDIEQELLAC